MKRYTCLTILFAMLFAVACKQKGSDAVGNETPNLPDTTEVKAIPAEQLISPGESIGHIKLEGSADSVMQLLGRPDTGDAAMGSQLATWYADHDTAGYQTSIFSRRDMGGKDEPVSRIKKILVTSPWFKTGEYISTGNNIKDIGKYYTLKEGNGYKRNGRSIKIYTDMAKGISFEIDENGKCVSILVHKPNSAADTYLNMH
ncbi:hypothetical protein [Mucilaginibacter gilvus]|uniref:Lipoprotein n=1 Tax=Mucilaginibacter gilvus TaxID=2305909 RepID=A0A3S3X7S1_9SPHI|nr:hypothetical protein [Mucilaginibacter gilvus]RWY52417.1 hypothetical protein EPL05_10950 [Mucilaginibacter gilvus]